MQKAWKALLWAWLALAGTVTAEPLLLVTGDDYAPYTDPTLPEGGMLTEVVLKALHAVGRQVKLDWKPWTRGYDETKRGTYAGTFPYVPTQERQADFLYSEPLLEIKQRVFVRPDTTINPAKIESFVGHVQCLPLGWAQSEQLTPLVQKKQLRLLRPAKIVDCARMVANGFGDFFVTDTLQGQKALQQANITSSKVEPHPMQLSKWALHFIVSKSRNDGPALISLFNSGLKKLRASGEYAEIVKRHTDLMLRQK